MPKRKKGGTPASAKPAAPAENNVEAMAIVARQQRSVECERMVMLAVNPILAKYRCRLGTIQEVLDGRPGPTRIIVIAEA